MAPKKSNGPNNKGIKCKNMMYEQQEGHLPFPIEELEPRIKRLKPTRYAYIFHEGDINEKGELEAPHVHVMLCFKNARYINAVAAKIGDKPQSITKWDERANNGFSYLLHVTDGASNKTKHDPSEVTANFDYVALVTMEIPGQIAEAREKKSGTVKTLLDMMYMGLKTKREVEAELSGSQYGRYKKQIDTIWAKRLEFMAAEWRKEKLAEGAQVQTVWLYGPAGCGKTSFAKAHARKKGQDYYVSGSCRDPFQSYSGEHTIILDELRTNALSFADLLRVLDPFSLMDQVMAPARYTDRALACDLIIVTTPFDPLEFYKEMFGPYALTTQIDNFGQLWRRLSLVIKMDYDCMEVMTMDGYGFHSVPGTSAPNPYSAKNRPAPKVNSLDLYRSMLDSAAPLTGQEKGGEDNDPGNPKKD